jgi:hypothetical protein
MNSEGKTNKESRFWDIVFLKNDHCWKADNDTDDEEEVEDPIGDIIEQEGQNKAESEDNPKVDGAYFSEEAIENKICSDFSSLDKNPWLNKETEEETYFLITNNSEKSYMPGEQVFFTYGRRSNNHCLLHYSFAYEGNKYEF